MGRNEEEKTEEPWVGRLILGIAAAGAAAVAAGAYFVLSTTEDSIEQDRTGDDDLPARPRRMMKGPDTGGQRISRDRFKKDPQNYFKTCREKGPKAAVDAFK